MKKAIVLFFAAASIVALVSCGSHTEGETKADSTAVAPAKADSAVSAVADSVKKDTTVVK